jgi:hypothetical protein
VYRNTWGTFWVDNAFQYRLTYPALPTLMLAVLDIFGLGNVTVLILIFHILLLCLIFFNAPHHLRPVVLLPLFLLKDFSLNIVIGVQDIVTSALIVAMLIAWRHSVLRAVLFGLACAFRQQPWLIAPFLAITIWYDEGTNRERLGRIGTFVGISVGVFMLINLPFIIQDPRSFLLGALEPSYAAFDVFGVGLNSPVGSEHCATLPRVLHRAANQHLRRAAGDSLAASLPGGQRFLAVPRPVLLGLLPQPAQLLGVLDSATALRRGALAGGRHLPTGADQRQTVSRGLPFCSRSAGSAQRRARRYSSAARQKCR